MKQFSAEKTKKLIKESGYRIDFLAEKAGVKRQTLVKYLAGGARPSCSVVKLLAVTLGVPEEALIVESA